MCIHHVRPGIFAVPSTKAAFLSIYTPMMYGLECECWPKCLFEKHKSPCDNRGIYVRSEKLSGRPTVAGTDKLNSLIFIRSKTPLYLVMIDQSAYITASVPTFPSSLLSRFWREQHQMFSVPWKERVARCAAKNVGQSGLPLWKAEVSVHPRLVRRSYF